MMCEHVAVRRSDTSNETAVIFGEPPVGDTMSANGTRGIAHALTANADKCDCGSVASRYQESPHTDVRAVSQYRS